MSRPMAPCVCVIAHWTTETERQEITLALTSARAAGDVEALPLLVSRLMQPCPARQGAALASRTMDPASLVTPSGRCHCGRPTRSDASESGSVCDQWPLCEGGVR